MPNILIDKWQVTYKLNELDTKFKYKIRQTLSLSLFLALSICLSLAPSLSVCCYYNYLLLFCRHGCWWWCFSISPPSCFLSCCIPIKKEKNKLMNRSFVSRQNYFSKLWLVFVQRVSKSDQGICEDDENIIIINTRRGSSEGTILFFSFCSLILSTYPSVCLSFYLTNYYFMICLSIYHFIRLPI